MAAVAGVGLVLVSGGAGLSARAAAQDAAPTPGVLDASPAQLECTAVEGVAGIYAIASDESEARYRVQEELASIGAIEAVGATKAIVGNLYLGAEGQPRACSRFDLDLRTLRSDDARRDNYLYNNTLETGTYPLATFVLSKVEGLEGPLADEAATFRLIGDLTLHGVTKPVAWEVTASRDDDAIVGKAWTVFEMPQFAITPPRV
ncbi:MAG: YceI family protein, partial [Chloroflexia bacterium]|nr:YceI family protein [Chloroflexia bacterium]